MLVVKNVNKKYIINEEVEFELGPLNIEFKNQGIVFLMGPSGCGKSTLLNILGCVENDYSGTFEIDGCDITHLKEKADFRNANIGYIFQDYNLFEERTVLENILVSDKLQGKKKNISKVQKLLEELDLADKITSKVKNLSGGQKQRVAIARALIKNPKIILCDEPTGALDEKTGEEIFNILKKKSSDHLVIIASHDNKSAEKFADRIIKIDDGKIIEDLIIKKNNDIEAKTTNKINKCSPSLIVKEGISCVLKKPIFLSLSLLVGCLSLGAFGLSFTVKEESQTDLTSEYILSNQIPYLSYRKEIKTCDLYGDENTSLKNFKNDLEFQNDIKRISNYSYVYDDFKSIESFLAPNYTSDEIDDSFFNVVSSIKGYCEITTDFLNDFDFTLVDGRLPNNDAEIVITKHVSDCFNMGGYRAKGIRISHPTILELLDKDIKIKDSTKSELQSFKIVGVLDTKIPKKFTIESYKNKTNSLLNNFEKYFNSGVLDNVIFVHENYRANNKPDFTNGIFISGINNAPDAYSSIVTTEFSDYYFSEAHKLSLLQSEKYNFCFDNNISNSNGSFYVPFNKLLYKNWVINRIKNLLTSKGNSSNLISQQDEANWFSLRVDEIVEYINNKIVNEENKITKDEFIDAIFRSGLDINDYYSESKIPELNALICAGAYDGNENNIYVTDNNITNLMVRTEALYKPCNLVVEPVPQDLGVVKSILLSNDREIVVEKDDIEYTNNNNYYLGTRICLAGYYMDDIGQAVQASPILRIAFLVAGLVFFALALLLLFFFFTSVGKNEFKKNSVLLCLGMRKRDLLKVSFVNAITIGFLLSITSVIACIIQFKLLTSAGGIMEKVSILKFGWPAVLAIVLVSFIGCVIANLGPFIKLVKMNLAQSLKCDE